jgi:hypothetical protein
MMVVDSNKTGPIHPNIILPLVAAQLETPDVPWQIATGDVLREMKRPTVDVKQFGNTLFIGEVCGNSMVGRALNIDKARNFVRSMLQYGAYLQSKGITEYTTYFDGTTLLSAMRIIKKHINGLDTKLAVNKVKKDKYKVVVNLGNDNIRWGHN